MRILEPIAGLVVPVLLAAAAHAQDAVLSQASPLLAEPAPKAAEVARLPANTPIAIVERKGGWYHVKGPGGEDGWVKLLAVRLTGRPANEAQGSTGTAGAALGGAASGGAGGAAAGALGSMMTGSSADSTAVRGAGSGKLSGKKLVDPAKAGKDAAAAADPGSYGPSDKDMEDFEKGLDAEPAADKPK